MCACLLLFLWVSCFIRYHYDETALCSWKCCWGFFSFRPGIVVLVKDGVCVVLGGGGSTGGKDLASDTACGFRLMTLMAAPPTGRVGSPKHGWWCYKIAASLGGLARVTVWREVNCGSPVSVPVNRHFKSANAEVLGPINWE